MTGALVHRLVIHGVWLIVALSLPDQAKAESPAFDPGRLSFMMDIDGRYSPYRQFFTTVLPGGESRLKLRQGASVGDIRVAATAGNFSRDRRGWRWRAPQKPGIYLLRITKTTTGELMLVRAFVLVPTHINARGDMFGYRIGHYPKPMRGLPAYYTPQGFIRVTAANLDTPVSPHFRLGQFVCKEASQGYPKYLVLRPRLLLKLEGLLEDVNRAGVRTDGFQVMSGYRTPFYNHAIGNVRNSRHQWGGAADIYIDENPRDGRMDDLNRDGRSNYRDAQWLGHLAATYVVRHRRRDLIGGVGVYGATPAHGPFVHIDVRGIGARWGYESE